MKEARIKMVEIDNHECTGCMFEEVVHCQAIVHELTKIFGKDCSNGEGYIYQLVEYEELTNAQPEPVTPKKSTHIEMQAYIDNNYCGYPDTLYYVAEFLCNEIDKLKESK